MYLSPTVWRWENLLFSHRHIPEFWWMIYPHDWLLIYPHEWFIIMIDFWWWLMRLIFAEVHIMSKSSKGASYTTAALEAMAPPPHMHACNRILFSLFLCKTTQLGSWGWYCWKPPELSLKTSQVNLKMFWGELWWRFSAVSHKAP